jgi:hypothetical protein
VVDVRQKPNEVALMGEDRDTKFGMLAEAPTGAKLTVAVIGRLTGTIVPVADKYTGMLNWSRLLISAVVTS